MSADGQPFPGRAAFPRALAADWNSEGRLFTNGQVDLFVSSTCGASWARVPYNVPDGFRGARQVVALVVDTAGTIYVGSGSNLMGLDRVSEDGGQTWRTSPILTRYLAASPSMPGVVYGFANIRANTGFTSLGRTLDGGRSWSYWDARWIDAPVGEMPYVWASSIVVDPRNADTVYSPHRGAVLRSTDGGRAFSSFFRMGITVSALALSIDGQRWWIAAPNDTLYTSTDDGASWRPISLPEPLNIERLVASPHDPDVVFAVTDRGVFAYRLPSPDAP